MNTPQEYGRDVIKSVAPWLVNVYAQNQKVRPPNTPPDITPAFPDVPQATAESCGLARRGGVAHQPSPSSVGSGGAANNLGLWEPGGINFDTVFRGLHEIGYTGYFTVHSRTSQANTPIDLATKTFAFLKPYADGTKG
jgi:hypothetical protein